MPVTTTTLPSVETPAAKLRAALVTAVAITIFTTAVGISGLHYRLLRLRMP